MSSWFKVDLTESEIAVVLEERHSHPTRSIRKRMNVVWMLYKGTHREEAAKLANVSRSTVQRVVRTFRQNRLDGVRKWEANGPVSELEPFRDIIRKSLEECPARTVAGRQYAFCAGQFVDKVRFVEFHGQVHVGSDTSWK